MPFHVVLARLEEENGKFPADVLASRLLQVMDNGLLCFENVGLIYQVQQGPKVLSQTVVPPEDVAPAEMVERYRAALQATLAELGWSLQE